MKFKWILISLALVLSACDLGPLSQPTPTPTATATPTATLVPTSTQTPIPSATETLLPTRTFTPTAVTCPKGTVLLSSLNRCFYATRTPKPPEPSYCSHFRYKWACMNQGCFWDRTNKVCL